MRERSAVKVARSVLRRGNLCKEVPLFCVVMLIQIMTLFIAPVLSGIAIELFSYWLEKKDKDDK
ncbi:type I toxin-antitoxin system Fst family toxin [Enterococcus faecalis]|uniref:type I toxin-antitoxin system Fst family toxin n=1 Tax=Enterococcus faecalis TaxID=1351 RepID=UPI003D0F38E9